MKITNLLLAFFLFLFLCSAAHGSGEYKVIFETTDCSGNTGFATVGADEIYKINQGDCSDPSDPGKHLKQLLVQDGNNSYKAYSLTQDEAKNVMLELKEYMKSRKNVLDRSDAIIIDKE